MSASPHAPSTENPSFLLQHGIVQGTTTSSYVALTVVKTGRGPSAGFRYRSLVDVYSSGHYFIEDPLNYASVDSVTGCGMLNLSFFPC